MKKLMIRVAVTAPVLFADAEALALGYSRWW